MSLFPRITLSLLFFFISLFTTPAHAVPDGEGNDVFIGNVGIGTTAPAGGLTVMSGNVGIGTWKPNSPLDIFRLGTGLRVGTGFDMSYQYFTALNYNGLTTTFDVASSQDMIIGINSTVSGSGPGQGLHLRTRGANRMYITGPGNIGIGTTTPVAGLAVMNGNVGVGTWSPTGSLQVVGGDLKVGLGTFDNPSANFDIYTTGNLEVDGSIFLADGTELTGAGDLGETSGWTDEGANVYTSTSTDNVGIGTTDPGSKLSVAGGVAIGSGAGYTSRAAPVNGLMVQGAVGIGTFNTPGFELQVSGVMAATSYIQGVYFRDGNNTAYLVDPASTTTSALLAGNVGLGTLTPGGALAVMNGNVGIGTWSPTELFQVRGGNINVRSTVGNNPAELRLADFNDRQLILQSSSNNGNNPFKITTTSTGSDLVIEHFGNPNAIFIDSNPANGIGLGTTTPVGGLAIMSGNVGIGTWSPRVGLELGDAGSIDNASGNNALYVEGDIEADGTIYGTFSGDGSGLSGVSNAWTDGGTNVFITDDFTNNVGIGTTTPTAQTHIRQTNAADALLVEDQADDATPFVVKDDGNVGIGTTTPMADLQIGNFSFGGSNRIQVGDGSNQRWFSLSTDTSSNNPMVFRSPLGMSLLVNSSSIEALRISNAGRIGIGTTLMSSGTGLSVMNGNVGIGTWNPTYALQVTGDLSVSGPVLASGGIVGHLQGPIIYAGSSQDSYLANSNLGIGTAFNTTARLSVIGGNVGIGTWSPRIGLELGSAGSIDNASGNNSLYVEGDIEADGTIYGTFSGDGSGLSGVSNAWTDGGTNVFITDDFTNNVGIGTTTPTAQTHIRQTNAADALLVEDQADDATPFVVKADGNVGVGTTSPAAKLEIGAAAGENTSFYLSDDDIGHSATSVAPANVYGVLRQADTSAGGLEISGFVDTGFPPSPSIVLRGTVVGTANTASSAVFISGYGTAGASRADMADSQSVFRIVNGSGFSNKLLFNVLGSGNVGIGTTTAGGALTVMTGNVGIGTWKPEYVVDILGTTAGNDGNGLRIFGGNPTGSSANLTFYPGSNDAANRSWVLSSYWEDPGDLAFMQSATATGDPYTNGHARFYLGNTGGVGIGTYMPVGGTAIMNGNVGIGTWKPEVGLQIGPGGSRTYATDADDLFVLDDIENDGLIFTPEMRATEYRIGGAALMSGLAPLTVGSQITAIKLRTAATDNIMWLTSDGNVGIGTTGPLGKLEVVGGDLRVGLGTFDNPSANFDIYTTGNLEVDGSIFLADGTEINEAADLGGTAGWTDDGDVVRLDTQSDRVGIGTTLNSANTKLAVMAGNVGIGTWSPRQAFEVNNTIILTSEYDNGNSGAAVTIDFANGNKQALTLDDNPAITFTAPQGTTNLLLRLIQDGTGSRTVTWPAAVKWPGGAAPTLTTTASAEDIVSCFYNGTNYYCTASMDFQ